MNVLGIETSCDETAAAAVTDAVAPGARILSNVVLSQDGAHAAYGGIVPEIAAREHLKHLDALIERAMDEAGLTFAELDGIAATAGPGLIGGVIVGVMTAKAISAVHSLPFLAVNHLEGHALTARLTGDVEFPYLLLIVSGGHCQLLLTEGVGAYRRLGTTIDDALGEAFDKTAKMLDLGYPGGPAVEAAAKTGNAARFALPRPMKGREGCHFSFSGLKTAVRHALADLPDGTDDAARADMCASFQEAAAETVIDRCRHAIAMAREQGVAIRDFVVAGGVAANTVLRARLAQLAENEDVNLVVPPPALCTDNGAMIAWAGLERLRLGLTDDLEFAPRPRWPLDPDAPPVAFAGVKA